MLTTFAINLQASRKFIDSLQTSVVFKRSVHKFAVLILKKSPTLDFRSTLDFHKRPAAVRIRNNAEGILYRVKFTHWWCPNRAVLFHPALIALIIVNAVGLLPYPAILRADRLQPTPNFSFWCRSDEMRSYGFKSRSLYGPCSNESDYAKRRWFFTILLAI